MRYFKKAGPATPIFIPNGDQVKFDTLDGKTGYHATENPVHLAAFEKCIKDKRGAIQEITKEEFESDYAKKKPTSQRYVYPSEPESLRGGVAHDTLQARVPAPAAAAEPAPVAPTAPEPAKPVVKPRIGKRPQAQAAAE